MGRGRAKAKQTKVARKLKYSGPDTDLQRLQAELSGKPVDEVEEEQQDQHDPYAQYSEDESQSPNE
jgi:hypothetical protein